MSDINISGIPYMGFQGGGGGYLGGIPNQQPAMSAAQINASMWGNYAPWMAQQTLDQIYGAGGFGAQTDYYSALAAAYGRNTGGFGGYGGAPAPAPQGPAPDPWAGTGFDPIQYLYDNPDVMRSATGDPSTFAYNHARNYGMPEGRLDESVFNVGANAVPYLQGRNMSGSLSPLNSYQGSGYNAFDPSIYGAAAQQNLGWRQPTAASPPPDFDFRWGDTPNVSGRPFQDQYEEFFNDATGVRRGSQGGWEQSYYEQNPDVLAAAQASGQGLNAFAQQHANQYGGDEHRQLFDSIKYLQNNPDVAKAGVGAWEHYNKWGRGEGRQETLGNVFDPKTYLMNNQDVAAAGVDPRTHWLQYGQQEGRQGGGIITGSRDNIARAMMQGTPEGGALGMNGPGGRFYGDWNPMSGGLLTAQQLRDQGNAVNMPSGQFGGHPPQTFGAPPAGNLGGQGIYQDPFGGLGYVPGGGIQPPAAWPIDTSGYGP
jgi:hypothetical protein